MKSIQLENNKYSTVLNALITLGFSVDSTSSQYTYLTYKDCSTQFIIESYNSSRENVYYFSIYEPTVGKGAFRMCMVSNFNNTPTTIWYEYITGGGIVISIVPSTSAIVGFIAIAEPSVKTNNKYVIIGTSYTYSYETYFKIDDTQYLTKSSMGQPFILTIQTDYIQLVKMIDLNDGEEFDNIYLVTTNPYGTHSYIEFYADSKKYIAFDLFNYYSSSSSSEKNPKIAFEVTDD